ncbi:MAG: DNA translocase FtsK 4TM domain-containing protein [Chloroflexota bacterium]|nr:DNA translocase FtsK 4TM domain-containing protein [Chloroflexota bacterium]
MAKRKKGRRLFIFRPQVMGIIFVIAALFTLLSLVSFRQGMVTGGWLHLLRQGFGWGVYLAPIGLGATGLWLLLRGMGRSPAVAWERVAGAVVLACLLLALTHLLIPGAEREAVARYGGGGGYLGWRLSSLLISSLGYWGGYILLFALIGAAISLLLSLSPLEIAAILGRMGRRLRQWRMAQGERASSSPVQSTPSSSERPSPAPSPSPRRAPPGMFFPRPRIIGGEHWELPPIAEILTDSPEPEVSQTEIRRRARTIEKTLTHFGLPATVMEVNQGPVVTQFGVEPGFITQRSGERKKVKVSQISARADDLALALAASPIRIETPIPGRSLVGIEVPNSQPALVSLRGVMESEEFQRLKSPLKIALGREVSGWPVVADLSTMPHLLIAGATGSGKSVCIKSIVSCLLCNNTPDQLKFIMVDPKMVELTLYNGIPHLLAPVMVEVEQVVEALKWVTHQMDERYQRFADIGASHLMDYNQRVASRGERGLPYIIVVIDELADLMVAAPQEVERLVCRIAQMARATGIHLVIATQRPSVDVVTGLIKANFPARISFATASRVDSRVVLDTEGAEKLLGEGDMLYMPPDSSKLVRIQGCFVPDSELRALVRYWKGTHAPALDLAEYI